jgi:hypothetical protein
VFAVQIPIKAPDSARGELEITYVDEELRLVVNDSFHFHVLSTKYPKRLNIETMLFFCRLSRGDKGNLFILKMFDPTYRIPL